MMKNQIKEPIKEEIKVNITPEDYPLYKSLIPELTVEIFRQHEMYIKEMFEYDPCDDDNLYDYDY
ncbi:hypothetical protein [Geminocystis sp. GBBB08]|uniref:hypothetical protein n=1 Tax=Geminocystis sp. GBBB08 TaxID=2604140 RepID=UPI0027E252A1|nr:hypothetical protein [Geminocystis sp. GBBB08]MBL1208282.1 hypothetical protein [Geminocystis sp. GBBB08]